MTRGEKSPANRSNYRLSDLVMRDSASQPYRVRRDVKTVRSGPGEGDQRRPNTTEESVKREPKKQE
jgi:hypothetical protein